MSIFHNKITIQNLSTSYPIKKSFFKSRLKHRVLNKINLSIKKGETLGLIGNTGSGKSTLAKSILRLIEPAQGNIFFENKNILNLEKNELKNIKQKIQILFKDPYSSLNPKMTIQDIICEPFYIHNIKVDKTVIKKILNLLQINSSCLKKFVHEVSLEEAQKINLARALSLKPEFIIFDEALFFIDVSVHDKLLNILSLLQKELNLSYLYISQNLQEIKYICHKVAIICLGNIVEEGPTEKIFNYPKHPYSKELIAKLDKDNY